MNDNWFVYVWWFDVVFYIFDEINYDVILNIGWEIFLLKEVEMFYWMGSIFLLNKWWLLKNVKVYKIFWLYVNK